MKQFSYTIQGEHGLHARCAGKLVQKAQNFTSNISIEYNQRIENLKRLFTILVLASVKVISLQSKLKVTTKLKPRMFLKIILKKIFKDKKHV